MKKCPFCAEEIQDEAVFCKYCRNELVPGSLPKARQKRLPAIVWGILVGMFIGLITIVRRGDMIATALDMMNYPPMDQLGSAVISGIVIGSLFNLLIWTVLTTLIVAFFRKAFHNISEAQALIYSAVLIVMIILSMTYFYSVRTLSNSVVQAIETNPTGQVVESKPVLVTSTPRPKVEIYFPKPMPGARSLGGSETGDYSKMTAEKIGQFFGVEIVEAYQVQSDMNLAPFKEFSAFFEKEMKSQGFVLKEKGDGYLVFYNGEVSKHIGIIYNETPKTYHFAQW